MLIRIVESITQLRYVDLSLNIICGDWFELMLKLFFPYTTELIKMKDIININESTIIRRTAC